MLPPNVLALNAFSIPDDILVVEDNAIIALDLEEVLRGLGASTVRTVSTVRRALEAIALSPPQFGLIDVNLGAEKSFAVAMRLRELGVPFLFTTGYGNDLALPAELALTRIVTKPYTAETLQAAMAAP